MRVNCCVAVGAQSDQIALGVIAQLASPNYVMDLELIAPATVLAFPAIPLQDFHLQLAVTTVFEPKPRSFGNNHAHAGGREQKKACSGSSSPQTAWGKTITSRRSFGGCLTA
jgi:hypothetical protein